MNDLTIRRYRGPGDDPALQAIGAPAPGDAPWASVAELAGTVVGYSRYDHWDEADGTRLYLLSGHTDPARLGQGIGRAVLARQETEAAAHWRAHPGAGRALLGGNADPARPQTLAMLLAAGYRLRFTLVDLARDPAGATDAELPAGLTLRPVRETDHPQIYRALQICFADAGLGQHVQTYQDYQDDIQDVDLWLVAWAGDEVAAVLINERRPDGSVDTPWVAVLPSWRRRGVARTLLQRSLRRLADHGVPKAVIRTVQQNPNQTVTLYENAGYQVTARHPRYAKPL